MVISQAMHFAFEEREHAGGLACRDDGKRLVDYTRAGARRQIGRRVIIVQSGNVPAGCAGMVPE